MNNDDKSIIVKGLIENFEEKGLEITHADFGEYQKPDVINNYKPDVIGWDSEKELYFFGTAISYKNTENGYDLEKFNELSNLMMDSGNSKGKRIPYYIGVSKDNATTIIRALDDTGISRDNIYTVEISEK